MIKINCPLCNYNKSKRLFYLGNKLFPLNISICLECGFVLQNPRFIKAAWDSYYESDYDTYHRPVALPGQLVKDQDANARVIDGRLQAANITHFQSMLDLGAGRGDILDYFIRQDPAGIKPLAIEPSRECQRILEDKGIRVLGSSLQPHGSPEKVDLIVMRHVLEHLYNPLEALQVIKGFMAQHTALYLEVPNLFSDAGGTFHFPHISYFNKTTLGLFTAKANLAATVLEEDDDELYGIFKLNGLDGRSSGTYEKNRETTLAYLRNRYGHMRIKTIKRLLTYGIPRALLHNFLMKKRNY
jgi:hypothetical protein